MRLFGQFGTRFRRPQVRVMMLLGAVLLVVVSAQAVASASTPHKHGTCIRGIRKVAVSKQRHSGRDGKRGHAGHACKGDAASKPRSKMSLDGASKSYSPAPPPVATPAPPPPTSPSSPPVIRNPCEEKPPPPTIVPTPPSGPEQTSLLISVGLGPNTGPPCSYFVSPPSTFSVVEASSGKVVATQAVSRNQSAYVPVAPGSYDVVAEVLAGASSEPAKVCSADYDAAGKWIMPTPVTAIEGEQTEVTVACGAP